MSARRTRPQLLTRSGYIAVAILVGALLLILLASRS